jgi:lipopolysaccharide export system protein LptA
MTSIVEPKRLALALILLVAAPAASLAATGTKADRPKVTDRSKESLTKLPSSSDVKPTGPMTIVSDKFDGVQGASAVYTGNVTMNSDTLKFDGDRAELAKSPDGHYLSKITGGPAHLNHLGNGPENPTVIAHSNSMTYDSKTGLVDLVGDSYLKRGDDEFTADTIHYSVNERRIQAAGGGSGQVRVVIQPPPPDAAPASDAPAPAPPAGAKP